MKFKLKLDIPEGVKKITAITIFFVALLWFYNYIGLPETMNMRPCSIHLWPQCERASVARNFSETDMNFFTPRIHRFVQGTGITGLEFPLVTYVPAICYRLFGFNEIYYRLFVLLSIVFGLFMFYKLLNKTTHNYFLSIGLTGAAYFSPSLVYYSNNFMPDVTSLGLVLGGWYYFFKFLQEGNRAKDYKIFWVLVIIAALIKVTSFIVFIVVLCLVVLDAFKFFKQPGKDFLFTPRQRIKIIYSFFAAVVALVVWYLYARWLNVHYKTEGFLMAHAPVTNMEEFLDIWAEIKKSHKFEYYPYEGYMLFLSMLGVLIIGYKFVSRLYFTITLLTIIGSLCFVFLFFGQFKYHDYYIIPLLPSTFLLVFTFADFLKRLSVRYSSVITYVFMIILFFNIKESARACERDFSRKYEPKYMRWVGDFESYNDLEPKLRKFGIKRTDYTLSGFDWTFCNSLYLMDQLGYSFRDDITHDEL
ncbi:MAG: ArnT family glycosyltransferase, partial [Bacteroidia bacterium]